MLLPSRACLAKVRLRETRRLRRYLCRNIVLILVDDRGYGSFCVPDANTSTIDRLAREGVILPVIIDHIEKLTPIE